MEKKNAVVIFLFFKNGLANLPQLFHNVATNSAEYGPDVLFPRFGIASTLAPILKLLDVTPTIKTYLYPIASMITYILSLISIIGSLISKNKYYSLLGLILVVLMLPVNSALYCGMYIIPVLLLYYTDNAIKKRAILSVSFLFILSPVQIVIDGFSINYIVDNIILITVWGYISYNQIPEIFNYAKGWVETDLAKNHE